METQQEKGAASTVPYDQKPSDITRSENRPNILLLMTDQQRHDTVAAAGFPHMYTPNMDRLAASGRLYRHAFTPIPDGMPARHNVLTGLTGKTHGYPENNKTYSMPGWINTFPRVLSDHGYETIAIGKNQFNPPRRHHGYDRIFLMEGRPGFREQDDFTMYLKSRGWGHILSLHGCENLLYHMPQQSLLPEEHQGDTWTADRAVDFIQNNSGRHPWMMKVSWLSPHPPLSPAPRFAELYEETELPDLQHSSTPLSPPARENARLTEGMPEEILNRYRQLYYGAISQVDYNIGRILDALEATGQLSNTLVIFTSDHGDMMGDHNCLEKGLPYDSCTRIPLILSYPGIIPPGGADDDFADLNDLFPTILDAAGIHISYKNTAFPGESLLKPPEERRKDRTCQYVEYSAGTRRWISLRTGTSKYNYYYNGGREELFDLEEDPAESRNILYGNNSESVEVLRRELRARLRQYEQDWGPEGCLQEEEFISLAEVPAQPKKVHRFPVFQKKIMDKEERNRMNNLNDELLQALEKTPRVPLENLNLEHWQKEGGLTDKQVRDLLEREKKMRQKQQNAGEN